MSRFALAVIAALAVGSTALTSQDRQVGGLRAGDLAPDFSLVPRNGGAPITLSAFRAKMPVALVFGSYT